MKRIRAVALLLALCLLLSACGGTQTPLERTAKYLKSAVPEPGFGSLDGDWIVFGLARAGADLSDGYFDRYYTAVEAAMQAAAQQFVGTHDFLALCAAGSSAAAHGDTVRTITDCHVTRRGDEVDIEVTADGYLYNMVRILAGTLCEVGAGRLRAADIPAILASRDRSRAGPTLPAKGLFLKCVDYPERKEEQQ